MKTSKPKTSNRSHNVSREAYDAMMRVLSMPLPQTSEKDKHSEFINTMNLRERINNVVYVI